jgi:protein PET117
MSRASKLTLLGTSLFALSTVVFVHYQQKAEQEVRLFLLPFPLLALPPRPIFPSHSGFKFPTLQSPNTTHATHHEHKLTSGTLRNQAMHQGVIRDMEQQRLKRERQADFDLQRALETEYKKEQTVRDSSSSDSGSNNPGKASSIPGSNGFMK